MFTKTGTLSPSTRRKVSLEGRPPTGYTEHYLERAIAHSYIMISDSKVSAMQGVPAE